MQDLSTIEEMLYKLPILSLIFPNSMTFIRLINDDKPASNNQSQS